MESLWKWDFPTFKAFISIQISLCQKTRRFTSYFITSLIFSIFLSSQSSASRFWWLSWSIKEPHFLLLLAGGTMMSSWALEVKIPAMVLLVIYIMLCVTKVSIPSLIMTYKEEKKFQWNFIKVLNFQWFQLSYFLKTTHFWLGDLKNLSRFLTESKIDNWFYLFFMKWIHLNYVSKKVISR